MHLQPLNPRTSLLLLPPASPAAALQYQYIENLAALVNSSSSTFQALSYSGDGTPAGKPGARCGCKACQGVPCGLAQTGPSPGPLQTDPSRQGAVSARLEGCGGSSGSCMTVNGQSCCLGVDSYSKATSSAGEAPCSGSMCGSYWSVVSAVKPLSDLWSRVQYALPR
jgi:hypothetical protein